ncbi:hypothetical protein PISMIDRAFT_526403 [Pisolithus microcarpus 441]|uniref:Uncharacterized protein n=1 Tax=Pisolithus microcarpus 441 TaxID=765257 RepID=A0A0C9YW73_9AGAM|nr:hypothetical protein PISMIDRAFT_526403 [Pisolithus microcarpus 441]
MRSDTLFDLRDCLDWHGKPEVCIVLWFRAVVEESANFAALHIAWWLVIVMASKRHALIRVSYEPTRTNHTGFKLERLSTKR